MKEKAFTVFLCVYLGFLGHHAVHEFSFIVAIGFILATIGHIYRNSVTPSFLLLHMSIEWIDWIHNPIGILGWLGRLLHAGMDIFFYKHEIQVHKRSLQWICGGIVCILLFIASSLCIKIPERIMESVHEFSLGGTIGCVVAHLLFHTHYVPQAKA
ncbi:MAG: hypothetical protein MUD00_00040 [Candidatus Pacebacteria bacterium]|jgi:hypothetical protein|nr:hypothetical protein [Candidatus Paceibacterota bacterium]